jgi:hypothetical protein
VSHNAHGARAPSNVESLIARMSIPGKLTIIPPSKGPRADPFPLLSNGNSDHASDDTAKVLLAKLRKSREDFVLEDKLISGEQSSDPRLQGVKIRQAEHMNMRF